MASPFGFGGYGAFPAPVTSSSPSLFGASTPQQNSNPFGFATSSSPSLFDFWASTPQQGSIPPSSSPSLSGASTLSGARTPHGSSIPPSSSPHGSSSPFGVAGMNPQFGTSNSPQQSSRPFGSGFGAPVTSSLFGAASSPQQTSPFGAVTTPFSGTPSSPQQNSTSLFGLGFAGPATSSLFGPVPPQQTSPFGGGFAGVIAPATSSLFGPVSTPQQTSPFGGAGFVAPQGSGFSNIFPSALSAGTGQAPVSHLCEGSRTCPYQPTPEEGGLYLMSVSAMNAYRNKSHEELRSEYYNQQWNGVPKSPSPSQVATPSLFSQPSNALSFSSFPSPSPINKPVSVSDPWSPTRQDKPDSGRCTCTCKCGQPSSVVQASTTPNPAVPQGYNINFSGQPFGFVEPQGATFVPAFYVNCIIPAFGAFGLNDGSSGAHLFNPAIENAPAPGSPASVPARVSTVPKSNPQPGTPPNFAFTGVCGPPATSFGGFKVNGIPASGSFFGSSTAPPVLRDTSSDGPQHACLIGGSLAARSSDAQWRTMSGSASKPANEDANGCSIPKGLEIIAEKLGFNPWVLEDSGNYSPTGQILTCGDACTDADIIALAEFAVEQNNAMGKDGKQEYVKVVAACLEAVDGGRYHIVLEAKAVSGTVRRRFYAAVLRKKSDRPNPLTVLEKWVPAPVPSFPF